MASGERAALKTLCPDTDVNHSATSAGSLEAQDKLSGVVERTVFHNPESGWSVIRVRPQGGRSFETVVGHAPSHQEGEWVVAEGEWVIDAQYGRQFRAASLRFSPPSTESGIRKYLGSGMVQGVGREFSGRLVDAFGEDLFEIIDKNPERLLEVEGIGPLRSKRITAAWNEHRAVRDAMLFLHSHGVGSARATRIHQLYGNDAMRIITENPYRLARDLRGVGFRTADAIAMSLGIKKTAMSRLQAGLAFALNEAQNQGHCGLPRNLLIEHTTALLEVPEERVNEALSEAIAHREVVAAETGGTDCVFLSTLYRAERAIAETMRTLARGHPPWSKIDAERALAWVAEKTGLELAESQSRAVRAALASRVLVITGGPGVGKTTIVNAVLRILAAKHVEILLCAPTGRAAKRLSQATEREAKTIHRLLEIDPASGGFRRNQELPLECDLLVVDEVSMVDIPLAHALLRALPPHAALLLVGDVDQLPSVGPGQVLADLIASRALPVARLTEVYRQAEKSRIIVNAHRINDGRLPDLEAPEGPSDFYYFRSDNPQDALARVRDLVVSRIPERFGFDAVRDIQVLCPMNQGVAGAHSLNMSLQADLVPEGHRSIRRFGWAFTPGDKVMQLRNDYEKSVYNGDIGFVAKIDGGENALVISFDGRLVRFSFNELDSLVPAYATTIHKSQGSEYPVVVIPILTQHYVMLQRNLLYTAVTRAKQLAVLVGQKKAISIAVRNVASRQRWTKLREWLQDRDD